MDKNDIDMMWVAYTIFATDKLSNKEEQDKRGGLWQLRFFFFLMYSCELSS